MSSPKGFPSQVKDNRVGAQHVTVEPVGVSQFGMTVSGTMFNFVVGTDATETNSNVSNNLFRIKATGHSVLKGDIIRFTSGTFSGREIKVSGIPDANNFDLVEELSSAPVNGTTFQILRAKAPVINSDGTLFTSSSGTLSFNRDGVATTVSEDTVTPANNRPLPVKLTDVTGDLNITAQNLNVQSTHTGANPDSMQIGDGTETMLVNPDGSINVVGTFSEVATAADGAVGLPALTKVISGFDGTNVQALKTDAAGELQIDVLSSALPSGAATEAKQDTGNTSLASIDGKVPANLTVTASRLLVDGSGVTQPVSAASLPLPTGAATEATLSTLNGKVPANLTVTATRLLVDGSGVTQPVSGTFFQATQPVSAASLPLPTGAATEAKQDTGNTSLSSIDSKIPASLTVTSTRLLVDGSGVTQPVSIAGTVTTTSAFLSVVDLLDTPLLDAGSTNIPGSASNSLSVVASLAAQVRKIQVLDTTGGFIGVFSGPVATPTLLFVVGPGSDQTIEHSISAGTLISVRSMTTSAITSGNLAMNFMG